MPDKEQPPLGDEWDTTWPQEMDGEERVRSVVETMRQPRGAAWIAARADVDAEAVRDLLEEMDTVEPVQVEGETRYRPDLAAKRERTREAFVEKSESELLYLREELTKELQGWESDDEVEEHRRRKREYLLDVVEDVLE